MLLYKSDQEVQIILTWYHTIEFSQNGFQWILEIQEIWLNTEAWIWMHLKIHSVICVLLALC